MKEVLEQLIYQSEINSSSHPEFDEDDINCLKPEANPNVEAANEYDWPIKVFYRLMRISQELGHNNVIDAGSSVEVDPADEALIRQVIELSHQESLRANYYQQYPSSWGLTALRQATADLYYHWAGIKLIPEFNIMVTGGIIKAVDSAIQSPKFTHVIIPDLAPYFARSLAILRGKGVIEVPLDLSTGNFDLQVLDQRLNQAQVAPLQALMYLTLPSSPAGTLPQEEFIEHQLIPFALDRQLFIISDSYIFATTHSGQPIRPLLSYPKAKRVAVEAIGVAKELGLPGIRVGAAAGNPELINLMRKYAATALDMIPTPNQQIAVNALSLIKPELIGRRLTQELHCEILPKFASLHWPVIVPHAGLDMLVEIPPAFRQVDTPDRSLLASLQFLGQYGIALCPASVFGTKGENYLRVVFKQKSGKVPQALNRLIQAGFDWRTYAPDPTLISGLNQLTSNLDLSRL